MTQPDLSPALMRLLMGCAEIGAAYVLGKSGLRWYLESKDVLVAEGHGLKRKWDISQVALRQAAEDNRL